MHFQGSNQSCNIKIILFHRIETQITTYKGCFIHRVQTSLATLRVFYLQGPNQQSVSSCRVQTKSVSSCRVNPVLQHKHCFYLTDKSCNTKSCFIHRAETIVLRHLKTQSCNTNIVFVSLKSCNTKGCFIHRVETKVLRRLSTQSCKQTLFLFH